MIVIMITAASSGVSSGCSPSSVHDSAIYLVLCLLPFVAAVCAHIDRIVCALVLLHYFILYYKINK